MEVRSLFLTLTILCLSTLWSHFSGQGYYTEAKRDLSYLPIIPYLPTIKKSIFLKKVDEIGFLPNFFNFQLKHLETCILTKFHWIILKISQFRTCKWFLHILVISWKSARDYVTNRPQKNCKLHLTYCKSGLF